MSTVTATEATDPDCLSPEAGADLLRDAPWRRLVVLGDSVAAGVSEPLAGYRDLSAADRLAEALGRAATRQGASLVGSNLAERDLRADEIRERQLDRALALRPDLALVSAGGNDALGRRFDPDAVRERLLALVRPLADAGALVLTIGLFDLARTGLVPAPYAAVMAERFDALDALTADVVARVGGVHARSHDHPAGRDPAIYAADRIHCNARGHAIAGAILVRDLAASLRGPAGSEDGPGVR